MQVYAVARGLGGLGAITAVATAAADTLAELALALALAANSASTAILLVAYGVRALAVALGLRHIARDLDVGMFVAGIITVGTAYGHTLASHASALTGDPTPTAVGAVPLIIDARVEASIVDLGIAPLAATAFAGGTRTDSAAAESACRYVALMFSVWSSPPQSSYNQAMYTHNNVAVAAVIIVALGWDALLDAVLDALDLGGVFASQGGVLPPVQGGDEGRLGGRSCDGELPVEIYQSEGGSGAERSKSRQDR